MKEFEKLADSIVDEALDFWIDETPIKSGNARSKTRKRKLSIRADYAYADRLDKGWSSQSRKGMSEPTIKEMQNIADKKVRKI